MKLLDLALMIFLTAALSLLLVNLDLITFAVALAFIVLPILIAWPRAYFIFFMVARPVMDLAAKKTFAGGVNIAAIASVLFIVVCGALILKKENLKTIRKNKFLMNFDRLFFLFLVASFGSIFNSEFFPATLSDFLRLLSIGVAVNYAALYFGDAARIRRLFMIIAASSLAPLLLGIYQFTFHKGMDELGYNRLFGTFTHTNVFSQYLVLICLLLIYAIWTFRGKERRFWLYLVAALAFFELFCTYTRGAWIALALSLTAYALLKSKSSHKVKFILIGGLLLLMLLPKLQERFADINEAKYYQLSSWQWRLKMWSMAAEYLKEHPFIGHGLGMYELKFSMMAHNDYLRIAYEIGFLGLFLYVSILVYLFAYAFIRMMRVKSAQIAQRYRIVVALTLALVTMSMVDNLARSTVVVMYFFAFIGALLTVKDENIIRE